MIEIAKAAATGAAAGLAWGGRRWPSRGMQGGVDRCQRGQALPALLLMLLWCGVVAIGVMHHEYWRDEVRALSSAIAPRHLWDLPADNLGESHPLLWFALLRLAHDIFPYKQVLPGASILCALLALLLFVTRAPFPMWWKALFVAGGLPLYEYVVMARNYGISMLLMFAFVAVLDSRRRSPVYLGGILFLLAQTNVHAAILVPLLALVWIWLWGESRRQPGAHAASRPEVGVGVLLAAAGLLCLVLEVYPTRHTLVTANLAAVAAAGGNAARGIAIAVIEPGYFFRKLTLLAALPGTVLLLAAIAGLVRRPVLAAAALLGLWGLGTFFAIVYNGGYRHQGVWFVFLVCVYWVALNDARAAPPEQEPRLRDTVFKAGLYGVMPLLLAIQCLAGWRAISNDVRNELSKSQALGAVVNADAALRRAVVLAQPDELLEVMPYYLDNPTFKIRENDWGNTPTQSLDIPREVSMGQLLQLVARLKAQTGRPVIFVTSFRWPQDGSGGTYSAGWGLNFTVTPEELAAFRKASAPLAIGGDAVEENFDAYVFR